MPKATREYGDVIHVRTSSAEKAALTALAQRENLSESDVIRRLLKAEAGMPLPVAATDRALLASHCDQLRKIGVNLNQAVRAMNEGRVGYDASMLKALQALGRAVVEQHNLLKEMSRVPRRRRGAAS